MQGYWLRHRYVSTGSITVGQTWRFKLPTTGLFSAFAIRISCKRDADRDDQPVVPQLHDLITKIEMTSEGVKVIKSMRARELLALNLFDFKRPNEMQDGEGDAEWNQFTVYLLAGRSLQDKKWMWDMDKFMDPEIAITNDVNSDDGTDFDVAELRYQIFGWRWIGDPVPVPVGYMRADERLHYDTTGAGVVKELTITRGHRIRRLLAMGWESAHTFAGHLSRLEVEVNEGEYSPATVDYPLEWCLQNKIDYDLDIVTVRYPLIYVADAAVYVEANMCYPLAAMVTPYSNVADNAPKVHTFDNGRLHVMSDEICHVNVVTRGVGFLTSLLIGFDQHPELEDMLDTRPMSKLALEMTETADSDTVSVVVEEEVLY